MLAIFLVGFARPALAADGAAPELFVPRQLPAHYTEEAPRRARPQALALADPRRSAPSPSPFPSPSPTNQTPPPPLDPGRRRRTRARRPGLLPRRRRRST